MPIKPENRKRYPKNWKEIRVDILKRANNRCEGSPKYPDCRAINYQKHPVTGSKVVLTVAHLDHTPENCDYKNLRAWCQRCHLTYDAKHHAETRQANNGQEGRRMATETAKDKKPRNKEKEKELRDKGQIDIITDSYQKLLKKAETARDHSTHEHFQIGFQNRNDKVIQALKRLNGVVKNAKAEDFDVIEDANDIKKFTLELRKAVDDKDAHCADIKFDCKELQEFCIGHDLFKKESKINKTAKFNNKTGLVEMSKYS